MLPSINSIVLALKIIRKPLNLHRFPCLFIRSVKGYRFVDLIFLSITFTIAINRTLTNPPFSKYIQLPVTSWWELQTSTTQHFGLHLVLLYRCTFWEPCPEGWVAEGLTLFSVEFVCFCLMVLNATFISVISVLLVVGDHTVVSFTTTFAISAYNHWCCEFESRSGRGVQHYVIKFVSDLRQVGCFLRVLHFPPPNLWESGDKLKK
jgi:hypothetical protein